MSDDIDRDTTDEGGEAESAAPPPRANPDLVGQERAEAALLECWRGGRLPHAWLLTGPRGIGKATLAFRFARFLFAQANAEAGLLASAPDSLAVDPGSPSFRRVASGGHADLLLIEIGYDPKRKRRRSEIVVDDVRTIADFLHLTSAEGSWRIVIVDGADEMNRNAANALLKVLEEPSRRSLMLITAASPGRLLPTIRSRCRQLVLDPLSEEQVVHLLGKYAPSLAADEASELAPLAAGSIGRALDLAQGGGLDIHRDIVTLLAGLPALDGAAVESLADRAGRASAGETFRLVAEILPARIAAMIRDNAAGGARQSSGRPLAGSLDRWVEVWEKLNHLFSLADAFNLDRKQVVLNAFFALEEASR